MKKLGFEYKSQTKCYYTDGHEREDVVKERNTFIKNYFNIELETMRWVQEGVTTDKRTIIYIFQGPFDEMFFTT